MRHATREMNREVAAGLMEIATGLEPPVGARPWRGRAMARAVSLVVFLIPTLVVQAAGAVPGVGTVQALPKDVYISATDQELVKHIGDFAAATSPFVAGGAYLAAKAKPGGEPGRIRVSAPSGEYYVYVAWARHPRGARDVLMRAGGVSARIDQSKLANGLSPDVFQRDDMAGFAGVCTSGLFRLSDRPIAFSDGDAVEVDRSDTEPGTYTTFNYVVFSPHLYLDDLGNDAALVGKPLINLKDYGADQSGLVGMGLAVVTTEKREETQPAQRPTTEDAAVEFTVPADGLFMLSTMVNSGPNRDRNMPLAVRMPDGTDVNLTLDGRMRQYGRAEWQKVGVLRGAKGAKLRLAAGKNGCSCADLLRLTPIAESGLARAGEQRFDTFTLQWERSSAGKPWLESVRVVPNAGTQLEVAGLGSGAGLPNGLQVKVGRHRMPVIGATDGSGVFDGARGAFRVELAGDYGFAVTVDLLLSQPCVWLKQLGVFACARGDFESHQSDIRSMEAQVEKAGKEPFRSTSEKYYQYTKFDQSRRGLDSRAFQFAYDLSRPLAPRTRESIKSMPEVNYEYFFDKVQDTTHQKMFLGWPNVAQHFYVLSNGLIGTCSNACYGTGHRPAEDFAVCFGAGAEPVFTQYGDTSVQQSIDDGYHVVCTTQWKAAGTDITETAFAYPLVGEEVKTGYEPLGGFVRLTRQPGSNVPLWMKVTPELYRDIYDNHLQGLGSVRVDNGRVMVGERIVLAYDQGKAHLVSASDRKGALIRLEPAGDRMDFVIPYIQVDETLVSGGVKLGFDAARAKMKAYWDRRLARGMVLDVPDRVIVNVNKTNYERTLQIAELGTDGVYALKISPIHYDAVWLHGTAYGIEGLARQGFYEEAKQYLDACFKWQGSQGVEFGTDFTTWDGFFNAPPQYTPLLWLNFHGWAQWAAARYFLYSDDKAYLQEKLPQLIKSLEWTASQRRLTMKLGLDGSKPINYGWLPPARVTDGSSGTSTFSDCINWMGFNELTRLLERIGHPRAEEFRAVADDYRACILRSLRLATRTRLPVRLNDGTWVPYVPGYLESESREEDMWYAAVVDAGLEGLLDSGILPPGEPLRDWLLGNLEDNLFTMAPNLADEAVFLGHALDYIRSDEPEMAVYTLFSVYAAHMYRPTLTGFEHRSWGIGRVWDLSEWPFGYLTRMLADMVAYSEGDEIIYGRATPKAWLDPGRKIRFERLQTRFGPTSFTLEGTPDSIVGFIDVPTRYRPTAAKLKLRVNGEVMSVKLNGRPASIDQAAGTVLLPKEGGPVSVEAAVRR